MDLRGDQRLAVHPQVLWRRVDDEAVLLHTGSGKYYTLDGVATRLWELLAEEGELDAVVERFVAEYEVGADRLRRDLHEFLAELAANGLIERVDGGDDDG